MTGTRFEPRHSPADTELEALVAAFFDLSAKDQLRAYEQIRTVIGRVVAPNEVDVKQEKRADSLVAVGRVAEHLSLDRPPTAPEFDRAAKELGLGWTSSSVGRAWVRWRHACEAFDGEKPRMSNEQRQLMGHYSGRGRRHNDYLAGIRLWLTTNPPLLSEAAYDAWVLDYNYSPRGKENPLVGASTARKQLATPWRDLLRVARGEVTLEDAERTRVASRGDRSEGPHDIIGSSSAARLLWVGLPYFHNLSHRPEFATPVLIISGSRGWLRDDVEVYKNTQRPPRRRPDELRKHYYDMAEVAALVGLGARSVGRGGAKAPKEVGSFGGHRYWLKRDVDNWCRQHHELIARRRRRFAAFNADLPIDLRGGEELGADAAA
jgi:hypothetical protein